ncbi:hypothetical protein VB734_13060 [Synechococcus sp. BA-124 BA4]|uniref:hypothetical protein n=1 Tax=Synechococcus sp. CBW1107 TaxID=2789857 RepID=UPI002AD1D366|nr:hypothetical protein [Synechococcus sp. CBW1107]MEA5400971.1 hypothetical protein [Synechococcus sp. BA-124 BA4]
MPDTPFPRGVRGRRSKANRVHFDNALGDPEGSTLASVLRLKSTGCAEHDITISSDNFESRHLIALAAGEVSKNILAKVSDSEQTSLEVMASFSIIGCVTFAAELGQAELRSIPNNGIYSVMQKQLAEDEGLAYIHVSSAVKPLAHIEREVIQKISSSGIPTLLLVNKVDLIESDEDYREVEQLMLNFASKVKGACIDCYMSSFASCEEEGSGLFSLQRVDEVLFSLIERNSSQFLLASQPNPQDPEGPPSPKIQQGEYIVFDDNSIGLDEDISIPFTPPDYYKLLLDRVNSLASDPSALLEEIKAIPPGTRAEILKHCRSYISPRVLPMLIKSLLFGGKS